MLELVLDLTLLKVVFVPVPPWHCYNSAIYLEQVLALEVVMQLLHSITGDYDKVDSTSGVGIGVLA